MTTLRLVDLSVRFGHGRHAHDAVCDVSLDLAAGEVLGLVGESGSGKSTVGFATVGLVRAVSGQVLLDGREIHRTRRQAHNRTRIQMIFQDPYSSLDPRMTIGDSVAEAMTTADRREQRWPKSPGSARRRHAAEAESLLESVGLDASTARLFPNKLSGGMRQRVAIARALAARPDVIVADEITSALDVSVQGSVLNVVRDLQKQLGFSMLFISHNLAVVRYVSDRVAVMRQGRIVEQGPAEQVISAPKHAYTKALLAAIPRLGETSDSWLSHVAKDVARESGPMS